MKPKNGGVNLLVTSISRKVPIIKALRKALVKLSFQGVITGADMDPFCAARYFTDSFWKMPPLDQLGFDDLKNFCLENKVTHVIPTRDGELPFFARYREALAGWGTSVMVAPEEAVGICLDKLQFAAHLLAIGYPAIKTTEDLEQLPGRSFVVKERFGSGSRNIGLDLNTERALEKAKTMARPVFQEFIEGREVSADLYVDRSGRTRGVVLRTRDLVVAGESQVSTTFRKPDLEEMLSYLAEKLKAYGHLVVQLIIDANDNFHIIECNCRFGGASVLSLEMGLDSFAWFLAESTGKDLSAYPFRRRGGEKRLVRYPEDLFLPAD